MSRLALVLAAGLIGLATVVAVGRIGDRIYLKTRLPESSFIAEQRAEISAGTWPADQLATAGAYYFSNTQSFGPINSPCRENIKVIDPGKQ